MANLVSTGLKNHAGKIKKSKPKEPPKRPSGPTGDDAKFKDDADPLFSNVLGFFNLIGVDKKSLSTIGINSLIVLVHLVRKILKTFLTLGKNFLNLGIILRKILTHPLTSPIKPYIAT